jgi:hypothetical protein
LRDRLLVEIIAEQIDAVAAGQVVKVVAVEVGDLHPVRGLHEHAGRQSLAHHAAELERHAVHRGELQVRKALARSFRLCNGRGEAGLEGFGQPGEGGAAPVGNGRGRIVGGEEALVVIFVERNEARHTLAHAGVAHHPWMLGAGQLEPLAPLGQAQREERGAAEATATFRRFILVTRFVWARAGAAFLLLMTGPI